MTKTQANSTANRLFKEGVTVAVERFRWNHTSGCYYNVLIGQSLEHADRDFRIRNLPAQSI